MMHLALIMLATAPAPTVHVLGVGNKSCVEWLRAERAKNIAAVENVHWLTGLISGANMIEAAAGAGNVTRPGDTLETAMASIHRYCAAHPRDRVSTAAQNLLGEWLERDAAGQ